VNPWRDDPEGDARFTATVNRIDAALAAPQRRPISRRAGVPTDILVTLLGLLLVGAGQLGAVVTL
jgi:hypothetical protein